MQVTVKQDFDGHFERLVRSWIARKNGDFKNTEVVITSGPYRSYAVAFEHEGTTLKLDFYSALRNGFGSISPEEVEQLIEML